MQSCLLSVLPTALWKPSGPSQDIVGLNPCFSTSAAFRWVDFSSQNPIKVGKAPLNGNDHNSSNLHFSFSFFLLMTLEAEMLQEVANDKASSVPQEPISKLQLLVFSAAAFPASEALGLPLPHHDRPSESISTKGIFSSPPQAFQQPISSCCLEHNRKIQLQTSGRRMLLPIHTCIFLL